MVIDSDRDTRDAICNALEALGQPAVSVADPEAAREWIRSGQRRLLFCSLAAMERLPVGTHASVGGAMVVAVVARSQLEQGLAAVTSGVAIDCLPTPAGRDEIALVLARARHHPAMSAAGGEAEADVDAEVGRVADPASARPGAADEPGRSMAAAPASAARPASAVRIELGGMVGSSESMREVFETIEKVAQHKASVLITGESGTGKELVARAIHDLSPRKRRPFIAINCGAIPANLLESELFGYRRGAFTDAVKDKAGLFEAADGGTLFLDEIGELPLNLQVKLLRTLQEEEIRRLGDSRPTKIDVRIIAATLRNLADDAGQGRFREDLFYRLNVLPLALPPLRERRGDIRLLVEHFVNLYRSRSRGPRSTAEGLSEAAMVVLEQYPWPGNIRELENAIERAMVLADGPLIEAEVLDDKLRAEAARVGAAERDQRDQAAASAVPDATSGGEAAAAPEPAASAAPKPSPAAGGTGNAEPADAAAAATGDDGDVAELWINRALSDPGSDLSLKRHIRRLEELLIRHALARVEANRHQAAKLLGISYRALLYKIKEYAI